MKAIVCSEFGPIEKLEIRPVPDPELRSRCARIGVKVVLPLVRARVLEDRAAGE